MVLCTSVVMIVVAVSSMNVALPSIQRSLGASGGELQWVVDAYALAFAGLLLFAGALGDRFGRRGALQAGLLLFGLAALIASSADDIGSLIAARGAMGVGAAFIMPSTLSIIMGIFPLCAERPKAIAVWAVFAGVGGALGPIISGMLLEHFWWGSVLLIDVPLVALLLVLSQRLVPTSKSSAGHPRCDRRHLVRWRADVLVYRDHRRTRRMDRPVHRDSIRPRCGVRSEVPTA